jgi:trypsin
VLVLLGACGRAPPSPSSRPQIIGGQATVGRSFMAGLTVDGADRPFCGGSFIAPDVVVTAAHCLDDAFEAQLRVSAGLQRRSDHWNAPTIPVRAVVLHPDFTQVGDADAALLFLDDYDPASLPHPVEPIALETRPDFPEATDDPMLSAIGWGQSSSFGSLTDDQLQEVRIPAIPLETCKTASEYESVHARVICAGDFERGGADSCQGDSGGPLIAERGGALTLVGLTSWGIDCAQKRQPGVYTRLASYGDWIAATIAAYRTSELGAELDQVTVNALYREYCHAPLATARDERDGLGFVRTTDAYSLEENLAPAADGPSAGPVLARCAFSRPADDAFEAVVRLDKKQNHQLRLTRARDGHAWTAKVSTSKRFTLACGSGAQHVRIVDGLGWFNHAVVDGLQYKFDAAAELPAGTVELRSCAVSGYHASVLRAGEELYLRVTPRSQEQGEKLYSLSRPVGLGSVSTTFAVASDTQGELAVKNDGSSEIFTWELACDFAFDLTDSTGQLLRATPRADGRFVHRFAHPTSPYGALAAGAEARFAYTAREPLRVGDGAKTCQVNSAAATLEIVAR